MILNTLDRFLVRRQPSQSQQEVTGAAAAAAASGGRDGSASEQVPGAAPVAPAAVTEGGAEDSGPYNPVSGTLDGFLVRRDDTLEASTSGRLADAEVRRQPLPRALMQRQLVGRLDPAATAAARRRGASQMGEIASLGMHAWGRAALSAHGPVTVPCEGREGGASVQALQFDSRGELLVAVSDEGLLNVHSTAQLLAQARLGVPRGAEAACDPLLLLDCGMPRVHSARWNPRDENIVGVASTATRQLLLFDLEHTQGRAKEVLTVPPQSMSLGLAGSVAVGLTDLAFPGGSGGGGYTLLAGGVGGQVFLWDQRARGTPQACLTAQHSGAICALLLAAGERVVVAGTQSGEVKAWDLRGGSSGTLRFGGALHHHPLLDSVSMRLALSAVPGLADQTAIPSTAVQWLQSDPRDERRLGFHLGCGWSGALDLSRHSITHLHAPPQHAASDGLPAAAEYAPTMHRRACWAADGSHFLAPSRSADALYLLDFSPMRDAGCAVPSGSDGGWGGGSSRRGQGAEDGPPAVKVRLSQPAICAAAHPGGELLVAGGKAGRLSVITGP